MTVPSESLKAAHAEVKAEIARTDSKTALLLAFVGAVLAGSWSVARDLPLNVPAAIVGGTGIAALVTAAWLLLRSVRPNLGGRRVGGRHGFPLWATLTTEEIPGAVARDLSTAIAGLSRLAVDKYTCLRRAVDLTCIGGGLILAAVLIALAGAA
ncbi:Pycsar system effector family protein [Streptomyces sp. NPDC026672]|uniref:Pycsar system effector family protein n=1 Tax=unclassified Streptomyces TaxID=2593676 RepID=UPI0033DF92D8